MTAPNFVKDNLLLHYHVARATGTGTASNTPTANVWKDLSGNGLDGTLKQFAYNENSGWTPNGLVFDGIDDHIEIVKNGLGIFDNQEFSIEVWATPDLPGMRTLFAYDFSQLAPYFCANVKTARNGDYNAIQFGFSINTKETFLGGLKHLPIGQDLSKPIHCVATFTSGTQKLYVDNDVSGLLGSFNEAGIPKYVGNPVYIGKTITNNKAYFKGTIHLVRYYTKVLSAEEVAQNYAAGLAWPNDPPPGAETLLKASANVIERKNKVYLTQPVVTI